MRKRLISIMLTGILILGLTSCGNTDTATVTTAVPQSTEMAGTDASQAISTGPETSMSVSNITVYKNGYIYTSNAKQEFVSAIAVQDGKFIYAGDDAGAAKYEEGLPKENIVDLEEALVTPGFIEGHTHFSFMAAMRSLNFENIPISANDSEETALTELKKW